MNKLFTPLKLRILILAQLKSFYHNMSIEKFNPEQIEQCEITESITSQNRISWQHFIRGRLTLSYLSTVNQYYSHNKLDQKYTAIWRMKDITLMLLNLHTDDWRNYCSLIHSPVPNINKIHSSLQYASNLTNYVLFAIHHSTLH